MVNFNFNIISCGKVLWIDWGGGGGVSVVEKLSENVEAGRVSVCSYYY